MKKTIAFLTSLFMATSASAAINGKNIILIHGFQPLNLLDGPQSDYEIKRNGYNYWPFWASKAEYRIDWDSNDRIEGRTAERAYEAVMQIARENGCSNGCVIVTHSTGDIVARYVLDNQEAWTRSAGLQPLKINAVLDLAAAGGGTELADLAVDVSSNYSWYMYPVREALRAVIGFDLDPRSLGVVNDLRPSKARTIATTPNSVPRLRFAGDGTEFLGVSKPFISGGNDSVVPLHSACGAVSNKAIDSCSNYVNMDGLRTNTNGPEGLWYNHYPVLQGDVAHNAGFKDEKQNIKMTYVYNNFNANGLKVDYDTYVERHKPWWYGWWQSPDYYQFVRDSENKTVGEVIFNALND